MSYGLSLLSGSVCVLTGSDASTGVMKSPKPNLTPKPPVRKCFWNWSFRRRNWTWSELDLNLSDAGSPGSPCSACSPGSSGSRWKTFSYWRNWVQVEVRSAPSSSSLIRYEPLQPISSRLCISWLHWLWLVCLFSHQPPGGGSLLPWQRWPTRSGGCRGKRPPWCTSCFGAARSWRGRAVGTVRRQKITWRRNFFQQ